MHFQGSQYSTRSKPSGRVGDCSASGSKLTGSSAGLQRDPGNLAVDIAIYSFEIVSPVRNVLD